MMFEQCLSSYFHQKMTSLVESKSPTFRGNQQNHIASLDPYQLYPHYHHIHPYIIYIYTHIHVIYTPYILSAKLLLLYTNYLKKQLTNSMPSEDHMYNKNII